MSFRTALNAAFKGLASTSRNVFKELGASGTQIFGGQITGVDWNPQWDDITRFDMVDEMTTDATVQSVINAIELPIKAAVTTVEPASDDLADMRIAEALEQDTLNNAKLNWREVEDHILTYLWYGYCVMWKNFEHFDGRLRWSTWGFRRPETIDRWDVLDDGTLNRIHQCTISPEGKTKNEWLEPAGGSDGQLFHIAYKQVGDNFRGVPVLRQTWKPYIFKRERMLAFARQAELGASGIPHAQYDGVMPVQGSSERTAVQQALETIYSGDKNYIESPEDVKIGIYGGKEFTGMDLIPGLNYLDQQIVGSMLATFLEQPKISVGSHAMQSVNMGLFLDNLEGISNYTECILNDGFRGMQHVRQYVDINFGKGKEYPKIKKGKINQMSLTDLANIVDTFAGAGMPITEEDWNVLRERLGLSEIEIDEMKDLANRGRRNGKKEEKTEEALN